MFTGIIEEIGVIKNIKNGAKSSVLTIAADKVLKETELGDSIAVNGTCLTVVKIGDGCFDADVMPETMQVTVLKKLKKGDRVNLERAMQANGRFGGHIVSGHIDSIGTITNIKKDDNAVWLTVGAEKDILKYMIRKGSVAIDGVSLTIAKISEKDFSVSIIPHTGKETTLLEKGIGDEVNLEVDILAKYVEQILQVKNSLESNNSSIDMDFLAENGFL